LANETNPVETDWTGRDGPVYKAAGLRGGNGAVESANYHVTGAWLMLQGIRSQLHGGVPRHKTYESIPFGFVINTRSAKL
jgi:hypothetical protein